MPLKSAYRGSPVTPGRQGARDFLFTFEVGFLGKADVDSDSDAARACASGAMH